LSKNPFKKKTVTTEKLYKLVEIDGKQKLVHVPDDTTPENVEVVGTSVQSPQIASSLNASQNTCWSCHLPGHQSPTDPNCPGHLKYLQDIANLCSQNYQNYQNTGHSGRQNFSKNFQKPGRGRGNGRRGGRGHWFPPNHEYFDHKHLQDQQIQTPTNEGNPENINVVYKDSTVTVTKCGVCNRIGHGANECWRIHPELRTSNSYKHQKN